MGSVRKTTCLGRISSRDFRPIDLLFGTNSLLFGTNRPKFSTDPLTVCVRAGGKTWITARTLTEVLAIEIA